MSTHVRDPSSATPLEDLFRVVYRGSPRRLHSISCHLARCSTNGSHDSAQKGLSLAAARSERAGCKGASAAKYQGLRPRRHQKVLSRVGNQYRTLQTRLMQKSTARHHKLVPLPEELTELRRCTPGSVHNTFSFGTGLETCSQLLPTVWFCHCNDSRYEGRHLQEVPTLFSTADTSFCVLLHAWTCAQTAVQSGVAGRLWGGYPIDLKLRLAF